MENNFPILFFFDQFVRGGPDLQEETPMRHQPKLFEKAGGYPDEMFVTNVPDEERTSVECCICYLAARRAKSCSNQHIFCTTCIHNWGLTTHANSRKCPVCRCPGPFASNEDVDKKLGKCEVMCQTEKCDWSGPLASYSLHDHGKSEDEEIKNLPDTPPPPPAQRRTIGHMQDQLQRSRDRLQFLLHVLSDELAVRRRSIENYQSDREAQTRQQIQEVNQLGRRLDNVAGNLMNLLAATAHAEVEPESESDSSTDELPPFRSRVDPLPRLNEVNRAPSYAPPRILQQPIAPRPDLGRGESTSPAISTASTSTVATTAPQTTNTPAVSASAAPPRTQPWVSQQSARTIVINVDSELSNTQAGAGTSNVTGSTPSSDTNNSLARTAGIAAATPSVTASHTSTNTAPVSVSPAVGPCAAVPAPPPGPPPSSHPRAATKNTASSTQPSTRSIPNSIARSRSNGSGTTGSSNAASRRNSNSNGTARSVAPPQSEESSVGTHRRVEVNRNRTSLVTSTTQQDSSRRSQSTGQRGSGLTPHPPQRPQSDARGAINPRRIVRARRISTQRQNSSNAGQLNGTGN